MNDKSKKIDAYIAGITDYFKGVKFEWGKITWPEKNQVIFETAFVVIIVYVLTVFIYLIDIMFDGIFDKILQVFRQFLG